MGEKHHPRRAVESPELQDRNVPARLLAQRAQIDENLVVWLEECPSQVAHLKQSKTKMHPSFHPTMIVFAHSSTQLTASVTL
ncbi:hypothetical protein CFP56_032247 [Quercus suber]|uniref:Uncharacterized protein n=1 Tax=Quercus suber TaxID=58331 RepID=A0AAW0LSG6_QUESU